MLENSHSSTSPATRRSDKGWRMEKVTVKRVSGKLSCVTGLRACWSLTRKPTLPFADQSLRHAQQEKSACTYFEPRLMSTVPAPTAMLMCAAMKRSRVPANGRLSPLCSLEYACCTRQGQRACERVKTLQDQ